MKTYPFAILIFIASMLAACEANQTSQRINATSSSEEQKQTTAASVSDPHITETYKMNDVADSIQSFIEPGRIVLAYKAMDLTGDGNKDAVIILREPVTSTVESHRACDFLVLQGQGTTFSLAAKNSKIVDCEFNETNAEARQLGLNEALDLSSELVKFTNTNQRGGYSSYSFKFSNNKWHLSEAVSTFKENNPETLEMDVFREEAKYPEDFELITMSEFDPDAIKVAMRKNRKLVP